MSLASICRMLRGLVELGKENTTELQGTSTRYNQHDAMMHKRTIFEEEQEDRAWRNQQLPGHRLEEKQVERGCQYKRLVMHELTRSLSRLLCERTPMLDKHI